MVVVERIDEVYTSLIIVGKAHAWPTQSRKQSQTLRTEMRETNSTEVVRLNYVIGGLCFIQMFIVYLFGIAFFCFVGEFFLFWRCFRDQEGNDVWLRGSNKRSFSLITLCPWSLVGVSKNHDAHVKLHSRWPFKTTRRTHPPPHNEGPICIEPEQLRYIQIWTKFPAGIQNITVRNAVAAPESP